MDLEEIILLQKSPMQDLGNTRFEFDPDDERDKTEMEPLRQSCMLAAIWIQELYAYSVLGDFLSDTLPPRRRFTVSCVKDWIRWYFSPNNQQYSSILFFALPLAYAISAMLSPRIPRPVAGSGILSFLVFCLVSFLLLIVIAYNATAGQVQAVYNPIYHERVEREEEYMTTFLYLEKSLELTTTHLRELESQGGLTEEYWLYGQQAWEYLRSGRADTIRELRPLLRRHIIENEVKSELDILAEQIEAIRQL